MDYLAHALDGYDLYFISIFAIRTLAFATSNRLLAVFVVYNICRFVKT